MDLIQLEHGQGLTYETANHNLQACTKAYVNSYNNKGSLHEYYRGMISVWKEIVKSLCECNDTRTCLTNEK